MYCVGIHKYISNFNNTTPKQEKTPNMFTFTSRTNIKWVGTSKSLRYENANLIAPKRANSANVNSNLKYKHF